MHIVSRLGRFSGGLALPVVIALLWVGLVRLTVLVLSTQGAPAIDRALAGPLLTVNLLLIVFLASGYLGRRAHRGATLADALGFGGAIALIAYLSVGLL